MKGKWIECGICCVVIMVRATFGFTEWDNHCSSIKHCQNIKEVEASGNQHKLTAYFGATKEDKNQKLLKVPNVMFTKDLKSQFHVQDSTMERTQNSYNYATSITKKGQFK